ncbi:hypothetical protein TNCV_3509031 [Trichonephila clavipes]|nr:hypothetical protein TNCV_3509031 [Trichonephila clavipes]
MRDRHECIAMADQKSHMTPNMKKYYPCAAKICAFGHRLNDLKRAGRYFAEVMVTDRKFELFANNENLPI